MTSRGRTAARIIGYVIFGIALFLAIIIFIASVAANINIFVFIVLLLLPIGLLILGILLIRYGNKLLEEKEEREDQLRRQRRRLDQGWDEEGEE